MEKDPVCGMDVDEQTAVARMQYQGKTYFFCAWSCKDKFEKAPEEYTNQIDQAEMVRQVGEAELSEVVAEGKWDFEKIGSTHQGD
ncbi:MAG: YHS domain-containing protein [Desulfobacterales bacterium]|nr:YHS domain-containing protein [Desulfobacterales bacterium]